MHWLDCASRGVITLSDIYSLDWFLLEIVELLFEGVF